MQKFEGDKEEERSGTTDQQAGDQDADKKKQGAETANRGEAESDEAEGDEEKRTGCTQHMIEIHTVKEVKTYLREMSAT